MGLVDKLFGNKSEKEIKRIEKYVDAIEALDEKMQALSDEELRAKIQEFKDRLHLSDTSLVQNNTTHKLYTIVFQVDGTVCCLSYYSKRFY